MNRRTFLALSAALVTAPAVAAFSRPQNPENRAPRWTEVDPRTVYFETDDQGISLALEYADLGVQQPPFIPDIWSDAALANIRSTPVLTKWRRGAYYDPPPLMNLTVDGQWVYQAKPADWPAVQAALDDLQRRTALRRQYAQKLGDALTDGGWRMMTSADRP
jgi:hypothetical protein